MIASLQMLCVNFFMERFKGNISSLKWIIPERAYVILQSNILPPKSFKNTVHITTIVYSQERCGKYIIGTKKYVKEHKEICEKNESHKIVTGVEVSLSGIPSVYMGKK